MLHPSDITPAGPIVWFIRLDRALHEADRPLEAVALAALAALGFDVTVDPSRRKGSQPAPPRILRTDLSRRLAGRHDVTQPKKLGPAEVTFGRARNGSVGGVASSPTAERPSVTRNAHRAQS